MKTFTSRNDNGAQSMELRRHAQRKSKRQAHGEPGSEGSGSHTTSREPPIFRILPGI